MEAHEALSRIVVRHAWLIAITVILGIFGGLAVAHSIGTHYLGTARFQAATTAPSSDTEAAAVSDRIKGIATSPQVVQGAIADANVNRSLREVKAAITVSRIGSSAIVDVTVSDRNPEVALALSRALAHRVAPWVDRTPREAIAPLLGDLDSVGRAVDKATTALPGPIATQAPSLDDTKTDLQAARQQLMADLATTANATIVSLPVAVTKSGDRMALLLPLGALAGLIAGLVLAAAHETLRPTVGSPATVARALQAPLVGRIGADRQVPAALVANVALAARHKDVKKIVVAGTVEAGELSLLQEALSVALAGLPPVDGEPLSWTTNGHAQRTNLFETNDLPAVSYTPVTTGTAVAVQTGRRWSSVGWPVEPAKRAATHMSVEMLTPESAQSQRRDVGLLVVTARFASVTDVDAIRDVEQMSGWPIIGVVGVAGKRA